MEKASTQNSFTAGLKGGIPIGLGYVSVGFAFGMMAVLEGLTPVQALIISLANVTSAGQFAGLNLIAAQAGLMEMALTQFVINMRYALMSISLSQKVDKTVHVLDRFLISFVNTDEVFAVAASQKGEVGKWYLYGLITCPYFGWALGTLLGAAAGDFLPAVITSALGIAIYGMFLAIIIPPARHNGAVLKVLIISVLLSCMFRYLPGLNKVSGGFAIIICTLVSAAAGALLYPVKEGE
ncbi:AzlC family ABC transporter permease [Anaerolentibacter hominis]|uniref:AzlC family ABC transporter permease n=1 Tax=Anaerolentibacter hominis TaxID=3079009 RepID=UPI0031B879EA